MFKNMLSLFAVGMALAISPLPSRAEGAAPVQVPVPQKLEALQAPTSSPAQVPPTGAMLSAPGQAGAPAAMAAPNNYQLAAGDSIRITVFQSPEMTLETRISENGTITYPLIGSIDIGGLPIADAEQKIAKALEEGRFIKQPQVNISLLQVIGNQVSVLGQVNRPGTYPLLTFGTRLTQMLATAGGLSPTGSPKVIISGTRHGKPFNQTIDVNSIYLEGHQDQDIVLAGGDSVFVPRAPTFYIYGEVKSPGQYVIEPNMTMEQAIAAGGGLTLRGSRNRISVKRTDGNGQLVKSKPALSDLVRKDDVIYIDESFF